MSDDIFEPDEVYDITIRGARVISVAHNGWIRFDVPGGPRHEIAPYSDAFTVERVAPAEWPPRPGDLWRDQHGAVWFAADLVNDGGGPAIYMLASHDDHQVVPDHCNEKYGPLTLVHRENEQGGGRSDG